MKKEEADKRVNKAVNFYKVINNLPSKEITVVKLPRGYSKIKTFIDCIQKDIDRLKGAIEDSNFCNDLLSDISKAEDLILEVRTRIEIRATKLQHSSIYGFMKGDKK